MPATALSRARLTIVVLLLATPAVEGAADGGLHLYLQPWPAEAAGLTFGIASVSAVTTTGAEFPLTMRLKTAGPAELGRQRLLAFGRVPTGSYAGLRFTVTQAALKTGQADVRLAVPDAPVRIDATFVVGSPQSTVLWLELRYRESVSGDTSFSPAFSVVTPARPLASRAGFATSLGSNTVTVFDKSLAQVVGVIDACAGPAGMALDQHRRRLYLACSKDDEVLAIDVATGDVLNRTRASPGDRPREIALTPDGTTLVSVNPGSNSVSVFDASSLTRRERVNVGSGPGSVAIEPAGRRAFVFNSLSSSVSVVDIASRSLVATVSTDSEPLRGKFNARGDRLYIIHERSPYMTVVDPAQLAIVTRARLRIGVGAIEVDRVRGLISVGGADDTAVEFYDPNALMPLYTMRAASGVSYLSIDAEESRLYMVSPSRRSLMVGRLGDRKLVAEIDVGDAPYSVAVMGEK